MNLIKENLVNSSPYQRLKGASRAGPRFAHSRRSHGRGSGWFRECSIARNAAALAIALRCLAAAPAQDNAPKPYAFTRSITAGSHRFNADFARIEVPEDRDRPDGPRVELALCRLRSTAERPGPPLFYIPGPPDSAARLRDEKSWSGFWASCLVHGDVVLMDQRGLGESRPKLTYDRPDWKPWLLYTDERTATEQILATARAARDKYAAQGVNVGAYDVRASVEDIEAVRSALGFERIRLMGHSGGAHLALAYVRTYGATVERLICVGTAGPNDIMKPPSESDESLRNIGRLMAADASIGKSMPDLEATVRRLRDKLKEKPLTVSVTDPRTKSSVKVPFGPYGLQLLLVQDLADERDFVDWPGLLASIEQGKTGKLRPILQKRVNAMAELPIALFASRAASGASADRWKQNEREAPGSVFGRARLLFCPAIGEALGVRDAGDAFRAPIRSDVSALFVSGTLDAHTPPAQAECVRAGFRNSTHVILENAGHDTILLDERTRGRIVEFLAGRAVPDETIKSDPIRFSNPP